MTQDRLYPANSGLTTQQASGFYHPSGFGVQPCHDHLHHSDTHTLQIVLQIVQVKEEMPFPKHPAVIRLSGAELLRGLEEPIAGFGTGEWSEHKFNETGPYGYGWGYGMWMYVVCPQIDSFNGDEDDDDDDDEPINPWIPGCLAYMFRMFRQLRQGIYIYRIMYIYSH